MVQHEDARRTPAPLARGAGPRLAPPKKGERACFPGRTRGVAGGHPAPHGAATTAHSPRVWRGPRTRTARPHTRGICSLHVHARVARAPARAQSFNVVLAHSKICAGCWLQQSVSNCVQTRCYE